MKLEIEGLKILSVLEIQFEESLNHHAVLSGRLLVRATHHQLGELPDCKVRCALPMIHGLKAKRRKIFQGNVESVELSGRELRFIATSHSGQRDRSIRSRMLGEDKPTELRRLQGIQTLLQKVDGVDLLRTKVACFYQLATTDYAALLNLARLSGAYLISNGIGPIQFQCKPAKRSKMVKPDEILPASERITFSRTVDGAKSNSFDLENDLAPNKGATTGRLNEQYHEVFPPAWGIETPDTQRSNRLLQYENGKKFRWSALLSPSKANITAGDVVVRNKSVRGMPRRMLVIRRRLSYRPQLRTTEQQLSNYIECGSCDAPPLPSPLLASGPITLQVGRVAKVNDPQKQGRIKVAFACHDRSGSPQNWEGIWCHVTRAVAGHQQGNAYGSLDLPRMGDWVLTAIDPTGCELPLVLTSCYRGQGNVPKSKNLETERIMFSTPDGIQLLTRDAHDGKPASLIINVGKKSRLMIDADGMVEWLTEKVEWTTQSFGIK